jgi:hypothetical protein
MKIGFFGDSFCMELENIHSEKYQYKTYLELIKNHYDADIVHLGEGGSSVWDVVINQFPSFQNNLPDICIFCWTDTYRLFHKDFRSLTGGSVLSLKDKDRNENHDKHKDVFEAAKYYFLKLHDPVKADLEAKAALHYFDDYVLRNIAGKTKILHMWSFEKYYHWSHGTEIKTPLMSIAQLKNFHPEEDYAPNHFGDQEKNNRVFEIIKSKIDSL